MTLDKQTRGPAKEPCKTCPYRKDAPSGLWSPSEYAKLPEYDRGTAWQPLKMFLCHLVKKSSPKRRTCAGWVATHDMKESLSVRVAAAQGDISLETLKQIREYVSPVPVFESGADAAVHGLADLENPSERARKMIEKIYCANSDVRLG